MKSNVDLTENQLFSRSNILKEIALGKLTLSIIAGNKLPWDLKNFQQIKSDDEFDLDHQRKSIIALGNKKQRAEVLGFRKMDSENYCDCCGARMNLKPWDKETGVCYKCNEHYNRQNKEKIHWKRKSIGIDEIRISVFDFN